MSSEPSVPSSIATRLGANLKRLRQNAGQTQTDVANRAGITRAHYAALEGGRGSNGGPANPRLGTLVDLAHAFDVPLNDLTEGLG